MSIVPDFIDTNSWQLASGSNIVSDSLTAGVNSLAYISVSQVAGGKSLAYASEGQPFLAVQAVTGTPEPASAALFFGAGLFGLSVAAYRRRHTFGA